MKPFDVTAIALATAVAGGLLGLGMAECGRSKIERQLDADAVILRDVLSDRLQHFGTSCDWHVTRIEEPLAREPLAYLEQRVDAIERANWWCRKDLPCFRDEHVCELVDKQHPVGCEAQRNAYCGGRVGGDCYQTLAACERSRKSDGMICLGVE